MCSTPVTFGGGINTVKGSRLSSGFDSKKSCFFQCLYHFSSTSAGLYLVDNSLIFNLDLSAAKVISLLGFAF